MEFWEEDSKNTDAVSSLDGFCSRCMMIASSDELRLRFYMKIESQDRSIQEILEAHFYKIPRFQRPYSWTRENVEDFWRDVVEESSQEYFIGSLVVYKNDDKTFGVVDGQQRLTTITMILCAIREFAKIEKNSDLVESTHRLIKRKNLKNKEQFVVKTETSYPYLQFKIQELEPSDEEYTTGAEEELLKEAYASIKSKVEERLNDLTKSATSKQKKKIISKELERIRDLFLKLNAIFIVLTKEEEAYEIFETLNTRGKDLSLSDLVKNHILRNYPAASIDADRAKERWNAMSKFLEESKADISMDAFLHHFWLSKYEYITSKKLFRSLKKKVKKSNVKDFLKELESNVKVYRSVVDPESHSWQRPEREIARCLKAVGLFRVKQPLPFVLAVMRAYLEAGLTKAQTQRALGLIENHHFMSSAIASQRSSGGASLRYASYGMKISAAKDKNARNKVITDLVGLLRAKKVTFNEFEEKFSDLKFSEEISKDKKLVQYVLARVDHSQNSTGRPASYEDMTIEHIAEQSGTTLKKVDIASIGNLILVSESLNNKLGTKPFSKKKKILRDDGSIFLDNIIKKSTTWGKKEISLRTKVLAKISYEEVWKY